MRAPFADGNLWAVAYGGKLLPFNDADAPLLLSSASGLVAALVRAGEVPTAIGIAGSFLRMRSDEGAVPLSTMMHLSSAARSFPGICLTDTIGIRSEGERLTVPVSLVRTIKTTTHRSWETRGTVSVELLDGSVYKRAKITDTSLEFLTLLGRQHIDLSRRGLTLCGHTVKEVAILRQRLHAALDHHRELAIKTVGPDTFQRYFHRAA